MPVKELPVRPAAKTRAGVGAMGDARRGPDRFYTAMGVIAILVAAAGFGGSVHAVASGAKTLTLLVHLHAAVSSAWLVLYIVQTGLVTTGRITVHRRLGIAAVALAV